MVEIIGGGSLINGTKPSILLLSTDYQLGNNSLKKAKVHDEILFI